MSRYARSLPCRQAGGIARRKIFNLGTLVYLIIFLLPSYLIKIDIYGVPTNLLEILIAGLFIGWIFKKEYRTNFKNIILKNKKYCLLIGLILVGLLISTKVGGNYKTSLGIIKGWFVFPIVFIFLSASILNKEQRKNAYLALFFSCFLVSLIALAYYLLGRITFDGRLQAFFNSPNYLAMYLAPAIFIGCFWAEEKIRGKKIVSAFLIGLAMLSVLISLYLTFSYASWVALSLALIIVFMLKAKSYKSIMLVFFIVALAFFLQIGSRKLTDLVKMDERSSFSSRMMIWTASKKMIMDNWAWGIGPGNFQAKYLECQKYFPPYLQWAVSHPHNLYFDFWLYSGIIGLLSFLALIIFLLKDLLKSKKDFLEIVALGILLYILFHGIADTTYFKNDLAAVFWMIFLAIL